MGRPNANIAGQKFGKLTALFWVPGQGRDGGWQCECECGRSIFIRRTVVVRRSLSCGCIKKAMTLDQAVGRFWEKVEKSDAGCWRWTAGKLASGGYGSFRCGFFPGETRAHRISWILANGPIPKKMHILHRCDNPECVRPDHLFIGTNYDNIVDRMKKDRSISKLTRAQAECIRRDRRSNKTIAAEYGVDRSLIPLIRHRKIWVIPDAPKTDETSPQ